jgi:ABC-2 type transport system ATP-binding protein
MSADLAIETRDLVRRFGGFGGHLALDHVSLEVPRGGVHAVVGRNGAGKSTLYRVLLGFLARSGGTSRVLGHESADLPPEVRGRIGYVCESHPLPGWMRVAELAAMQRGVHPRWSDATFGAIASLFQLSSDRFARQLSRGERAGLAIALAVAPQPELLVLDEPTFGLDVVASRAVLESLLFAAEGEPGTIVYSSHRMAEVERVADRVVVLDRGSVVAAAPPDELHARVSGWTVDGWPSDRAFESIPGLLDARRIEDQLHVAVLDTGPGFAGRLEELGASGVAQVRVTQVPLGFERAMDAFLRGVESGGRSSGRGGTL